MKQFELNSGQIDDFSDPASFTARTPAAGWLLVSKKVKLKHNLIK